MSEEKKDIIADLTRIIESLKAEKQYIESEKIRLDRELRSIKTELDRMRQPPLVTASVVKILDDGRLVVRSTTGPLFVVKYSSKIPKEDLKPGTEVALNQRTFSIVEILSEVEKRSYSPDRAWKGVPYEITIIEVKDWGEIEANQTGQFFIRFKTLEDLKVAARNFRVPVLFKKNDEYLAFYYENFLFWYKPEG